MTITLLNNIESLRAQREMSRSLYEIEHTSRELGIGGRINKPSDDPAGLSLSSKLLTKNRILSQSLRNIGDGISVSNILSSSLQELSSISIRIGELAEQASNGTFSDLQRKALHEEAVSLREEYYRIANTTEFNGVKLYTDQSNQQIRLQAGNTSEAGALYISIPNLLGSGDPTTVTTSTTTIVTTGDGILNIGSSSSNVAPLSLSSSYRVIESVDINGDGAMDFLASPSGIGAGVLQMMLNDGSGNYTTSTIFYRNGTGGSGDWAEPLVGDVDNDGNLDIVVGNFGSLVLHGDGNGGFTEGWSQTGITEALGDFNGDGNLDLISYDSVSSFSFKSNFGDGTGSFGPTVLDNGGGSFTYNSPGNIEVYDFNGDGRDDLLMEFSNNPGGSVFFSNGDGSFTQGSTINNNGTSFADEVEIYDINGDGVQDIIAPGTTGTRMFVYRLGNGDGTFQSEVAVQTSGYRSFVSRIEFGDLNGDGLVEAAVRTSGNGGTPRGTNLYSWNGSSFSFVNHYNTGSLVPNQIEFFDVDGSGTDDLVVSTPGAGVQYFSNNTDLIETTTVTTTTTTTIPGGASIFPEVDLRTQSAAMSTLDLMQSVQSAISTAIGEVGAQQSRLISAYEVIATEGLNVLDAGSRIADADMANSAANNAKANIRLQAGSSILSQANQTGRLVLNLLG